MDRHRWHALVAMCWGKGSVGTIISPSSLILLAKDRRFDYSHYFNTEPGLLQVCWRLCTKPYSQKEGTEQEDYDTGTGFRKNQWDPPAPNLSPTEAPWFLLEANEASHGLVKINGKRSALLSTQQCIFTIAVKKMYAISNSNVSNTTESILKISHGTSVFLLNYRWTPLGFLLCQSSGFGETPSRYLQAYIVTSSHISSQALTLLRDLQKLDKACQWCAEDAANQADYHAHTLFP